MAKVKFGMFMVDARGKVGGQVFSKNRAGSYVRTKTTPVNPQTVAQTLVRVLFGLISQAWSGFTDSVRNGFNEAVSDWSTTDIFGDLKNPSGKALHQRLSNQAQSAGHPAVNSVPAKASVPNIELGDVQVAIGLGTIDLDSNLQTNGTRTMVFATNSLSAGTKFHKNKLRLIYTSVSDAIVNADLYAAYVVKFGAPAIGANIFFNAKNVLPSGQASVPSSANADVIA